MNDGARKQSLIRNFHYVTPDLRILEEKRTSWKYNLSELLLISFVNCYGFMHDKTFNDRIQLSLLVIALQKLHIDTNYCRKLLK